MAKPRLKISRTHTPYACSAYGHSIALPVGTVVTNQTACGPDDAYRFVRDTAALARQITGLADSILAHDLKHYGLNVPAEFCEPYESASTVVPASVKTNWFMAVPPSYVVDGFPEYTCMVIAEPGNVMEEAAVKARKKLAFHLTRETSNEIHPAEILILACLRDLSHLASVHLTMGDEVFTEVVPIVISDEQAGL